MNLITEIGEPKIRIEVFRIVIGSFKSADNTQNKIFFNSIFTQNFGTCPQENERKKVRALITLTSVVCFALTFKRFHENDLITSLLIIF
jgi:hypothetical protein